MINYTANIITSFQNGSIYHVNLMLSLLSLKQLMRILLDLLIFTMN